MAKQPTDAEIETAIEWMKCHDGAHEPDNARDLAAVIAWLDDVLAQRLIRSEARRLGVPTARLRKKTAEQIGKEPPCANCGQHWASHPVSPELQCPRYKPAAS